MDRVFLFLSFALFLSFTMILYSSAESINHHRAYKNICEQAGGVAIIDNDNKDHCNKKDSNVDIRLP